MDRIISARIAGIPCQLRVTQYLHVKPFAGSSRYCDSPEDYYGYSDIDFEVLDQRGRPAAWLARKVDARERARLEAEIIKHMEGD